VARRIRPVGTVHARGPVSRPVRLSTPRRRVKPLTYAHQLARNHRASYLALSTALFLDIFERCELSRLAEFKPTADQKVGISRPASFPVELLEPLADLNGGVSAGAGFGAIF